MAQIEERHGSWGQLHRRRWMLVSGSVLLLLAASCGGGGEGNENNNNNEQQAICGNGVVETGEQCDNGADNSDTTPDACRSNCRLASCGDGVTDTGEVCDGAAPEGQTCTTIGENFTSGQLGCSATCELDTSDCALCGDGILGTGEECDGQALGGASCLTATGKQEGNLTCKSDCTFDTSRCHTCGDDVIEADEVCDGTALSGQTCGGLGYGAGELACQSDCTAYDTSPCCGDGVLGGTEECDDQDFGTATCQSETSKPDGALACSATCELITTDCHNCGDGIIESPAEACDGNNIAGATCAGHGYTLGGTVACASDCRSLDLTQCCGDGTRAGTEECDDGNADFWDGCNDCTIAEFVVNHDYNNGTQDLPAVASADNGMIVVVWQGEGTADTDGVWGQLVDNQGQDMGGIFRVNTVTTDRQNHPAVGMAGDGRFVVVWEDRNAYPNYSSILAQRYDATGSPVGSSINVQLGLSFDRQWPAVAMADDGRYIVAWWLDHGSYDYWIEGSHFWFNSPGGSSLAISPTTTGARNEPAIAMAPDGRATVAWSGFGSGSDTFGIYRQRFNASHYAIGSEEQVNTYETSYQQHPSVGAAADGRTVIVWQSSGQDGSDEGVYAQRFDTTGAAAGSEFQVNTTTLHSQAGPVTAMADDGRFVVAYYSVNAGYTGFDAFVQRFDASGVAQGSPVQLNNRGTSTQGGQELEISMVADGRYVVVWSMMVNTGSDGAQVYAQRFDAQGNALGRLPW